MVRRTLLILLFAGVAFANTPPVAPVIVEPAMDLQALNGADAHMVTDVDGDEHRCTDWEIRDEAGASVGSGLRSSFPNNSGEIS